MGKGLLPMFPCWLHRKWKSMGVGKRELIGRVVKMVLVLYMLHFLFKLLRMVKRRMRNSPRSLVVLAGQSNMRGRGQRPLLANFARPSSDILVWQENPQGGDGGWEVAHHPLHYDDAPHKLGVGPGLAFAKAGIQSGLLCPPVGLIPVAKGGSTLSEDWSPVVVPTKDRTYGLSFSRACQRVRRAVAAAPDGSVDVILWLQGESEASNGGITSSWFSVQTVQTLKAFRKCVRSPEARIVMGELPSFMKTNPGYPGVAEVNRGLRKAASSLDKCQIVSADPSSTSVGDFLHYDADSAERLGERMADIAAKPLGGDQVRRVKTSE